MALFGKVEDLLPLIRPGSRLHRGLSLLKDYLDGRSPELDKIVRNQKAGDKAQITIDGDSLFLIIQCYAPKPPQEGRFEAHQRHTDLQFICAGKEWIAVCDLRKQTGLPAFDANGNVFFPLGNAAHSRLLLEAGNVAVLFPNDAHAPCLRVEGDKDDLVRKIVVKVKDAHLNWDL
jgi:biofilm protein TabA